MHAYTFWVGVSIIDGRVVGCWFYQQISRLGSRANILRYLWEDLLVATCDRITGNLMYEAASNPMTTLTTTHAEGLPHTPSMIPHKSYIEGIFYPRTSTGGGNAESLWQRRGYRKSAITIPVRCEIRSKPGRVVEGILHILIIPRGKKEGAISV